MSALDQNNYLQILSTFRSHQVHFYIKKEEQSLKTLPFIYCIYRGDPISYTKLI